MGDVRAPTGLESRAVELVLEALEVGGLSQSELARRVGVTPSAVSNVLAGHSARGVTLARLERWMAALGWEVELSSSFVGTAAASPAPSDSTEEAA